MGGVVGGGVTRAVLNVVGVVGVWKGGVNVVGVVRRWDWWGGFRGLSGAVSRERAVCRVVVPEVGLSGWFGLGTVRGGGDARMGTVRIRECCQEP